MPIFEYVCKDCKEGFEALIMGGREAECPKCHGHNLGQKFSVFSASVAKPAAPAPGGCCAPSGGACGMGRCCMDN